jgi:anti-anti-sigma factor
MSTPNYHHVAVSVEQGVLVLTLIDQQIRGDEVAEAVRREITDALERSGARQCVLNLQHVQSVSSSGLRPIIHLRREIQNLSGQLRICGVSEFISDVLHTVRLFTQPFDIQPDVAAAVANLNMTATGSKSEAKAP